MEVLREIGGDESQSVINKATGVIPGVEGYFICCATRDKEIEEKILTKYLVGFALPVAEDTVKGTPDCICVWEFANKGNIDYYQTRMVIFKRLSQAYAIAELLSKNGPFYCAVFYRKWDPQIQRYITVNNAKLRFKRFIEACKSAYRRMFAFNK